MSRIASFLPVIFLSALGFCQLPSSDCDRVGQNITECPFLAVSGSAEMNVPSSDSLPLGGVSDVGVSSAEPGFGAAAGGSMFLPASTTPKRTGFRWGRALFESFTFLAIEQAYVVHDDYRWVTAENGIPFNHYWRDYKQSLHSWIDAGWNDGDPALYSYVGHPIQGAMVSFIQIQNDPEGENLELSNTKEYWRSRLKATLWNAVYSTQWNIGPLSELTVEKYGAKVRGPWNQDGTWPCRSRHCFNGVGQVDLVITPIGGLGWVLAEDWLDRSLARRVEGTTRNQFLINFTRCAVSPIRGGANILHGRRPWYRARDARGVFFSHQHGNRDASEAPTATLP